MKYLIASTAKHCSVMPHIVTSVPLPMNKFTLNLVRMCLTISAMFKQGSNNNYRIAVLIEDVTAIKE